MRSINIPSYELETGDVIKYDNGTTLFFIVELNTIYLMIGSFGINEKYSSYYSSHSKESLNTMLRSGTIKLMYHSNVISFD
jgi:hypothetical protein